LRRAGRTLKGEKLGDLPVTQASSSILFLISRKQKALGLECLNSLVIMMGDGE
jgi:hypothetical protein